MYVNGKFWKGIFFFFWRTNLEGNIDKEEERDRKVKQSAGGLRNINLISCGWKWCRRHWNQVARKFVLCYLHVYSYYTKTANIKPFYILISATFFFFFFDKISATFGYCTCGSSYNFILLGIAWIFHPTKYGNYMC